MILNVLWVWYCDYCLIFCLKATIADEFNKKSKSKSKSKWRKTVNEMDVSIFLVDLNETQLFTFGWFEWNTVFISKSSLEKYQVCMFKCNMNNLSQITFQIVYTFSLQFGLFRCKCYICITSNDVFWWVKNTLPFNVQSH